MPELPEVELISRSLNTLVKGRTIEAASLLREKLAPDVTPELFSRKLERVTINFVHRRGKYILFDLSSNETLIVHLRMSGRFSLLRSEAPNPKFTHAIFELDNDEKLIFDDQRHFGFMTIVATSDVYNLRSIAQLAPEPFSEEFSTAYFYHVLKSSKRSLKEVLIDQKKVCGVGNIYASEAMFAAGIHPAISAHKMSKPRSALLHAAVIAVLKEAIDYASNRDVDPEYLEGSYFSGSDDPSWYVYDRENEECRNCNSPILRLKQGGRSTYFCRKCQRR